MAHYRQQQQAQHQGGRFGASANKRSVSATINQPAPLPPAASSRERGGAVQSSSVGLVPTSSQDLSSSPFKKLKTTNGPPAGGGNAPGSNSSTAAPGPRPLQQKAAAQSAAGSVLRPAVRESKPWKTPQWLAQNNAGNAKRRDTRRSSNYYEGFNFNKSGGSNQLLFANTPSASKDHQPPAPHHPTARPLPSPIVRGNPALALRTTTSVSKPAISTTSTVTAASSTYHPHPLMAKTAPRVASIQPESSNRAIKQPPLHYAEVEDDDQGDGFTLKSLDFRGSQGGDDLKSSQHLKTATTSSIAVEVDPFLTEDILALALAQGEAKIGDEREDKLQNMPNGTDRPTLQRQALMQARSRTSNDTPRQPHPMVGPSSNRPINPPASDWHQRKGNKEEPLVIDDEPKEGIKQLETNENSNSESYDDDSGWLYEAIIAEPDLERAKDKKRKREDSPRAKQKDDDNLTVSSPSDSLLLVPQTNSSEPMGSMTSAKTAHGVPESSARTSNGVMDPDDIIFIQALDQVEHGKGALSDDSHDPGRVPPSASTEDDILSINPLTSMGLSVPDHMASSSLSGGSPQPPTMKLAKFDAEDLHRVKQENRQLAQEKITANKDNDRMRQEVVALQRQLHQYQLLLQEANEAKKAQLDNNATVRQQLRENHAQLQQIKNLQEQVFARERDLAAAEEEKRLLSAELEGVRSRVLKRDSTYANDAERKSVASADRKRKRKSTDPVHAEDQASVMKLDSLSLAPLIPTSDVSIVHHLLDRDMSGHLFALLGSDLVEPVPGQRQVEGSGTESSSLSGVAQLLRLGSSQSLNESQTESERLHQLKDRRQNLAIELRQAIAKVLFERAPLTILLPVLVGFISLVKKRPSKSADRDRNNDGHHTSSKVTTCDNSTVIALLFSALCVLHMLVRSSEDCRRAILWEEKDELEEHERCKAEALLHVAAATERQNGKPKMHAEISAASSRSSEGQAFGARIFASRKSVSDTSNAAEANVPAGHGIARINHESDGVAHHPPSSLLQRQRSLVSLFLLGQDCSNFADAEVSGSEQDLFAMLSRYDPSVSVTDSSSHDFQLLPTYLDSTAHELANSVKRQSVLVPHAKIYTPKLLRLLINRVLKRREISMLKHGDVIAQALRVINDLSWRCPSHLLHKFESLFTTNLLFSFLGRSTSLSTKELSVDILINLFRNPSFLPMLKKTANGGLTLLDRAIKYLGAEMYDTAEIRGLRIKVVRLVSMLQMKYKDVCGEILHSKKEKAARLFSSLGVCLYIEVEALQDLPACPLGASDSAALVREIVNLLLLLINHLGRGAVIEHIATATHPYLRAMQLLASQGVHASVSDLAESAALLHSSLFPTNPTEAPPP